MKIMRTTAAIAAMAIVGLVTAGAAPSVDKAALAKKQEALVSEYNLAKESNFYFVLDVVGRKLELRVRGMVLRSWPLRAMRFWGRPDFAGMVELAKKTALKSPQRIIIKPGEEEALVKTPDPSAKPAAAPGLTTASADYDLEALELRDMPKRFSLDFDNGLRITIKAKEGGSGLLRSLKDAWRWYVGLPLKHIFSSRQGGGPSEIELTFDKESDAQAIYWHFFEGIKGIFL